MRDFALLLYASTGVFGMMRRSSSWVNVTSVAGVFRGSARVQAGTTNVWRCHGHCVLHDMPTLADTRIRTSTSVQDFTKLKCID